MKFLNLRNVLCLSPHPDDVEYGMAGTILKFPDTKFDILCLSSGGNFDTTNNERIKEVVKFWTESESKNVDVYQSGFNKMDALKEDGWINLIETEYVNKKGYDAIFIPPEIDSHFEHKFVNSFGLALTRHRPISVVEYCTPSTLEGWVSNLQVNVTSTYVKKMELMTNFVSQASRAYFSHETLEYFHFQYQLAKRGLHRVERFKTIHYIVA
jgi:LmbE family N-acetylglucosaminyl deacetylase